MMCEQDHKLFELRIWQHNLLADSVFIGFPFNSLFIYMYEANHGIFI